MIPVTSPTVKSMGIFSKNEADLEASLEFLLVGGDHLTNPNSDRSIKSSNNLEENNKDWKFTLPHIKILQSHKSKNTMKLI